MKLIDLLSRDAIISQLKNTTKEGVIEEMAELIAKVYPKLDKNEIATALLDREKLGSTGIDHGIAIPHTKLKELDHIILAVGRSPEGIEFQAHDGNPSYLFFILLAPDSSAGVHLKTLARLSRLLKEEKIRSELMEAKNSEEIYTYIKTEDENLPC